MSSCGWMSCCWRRRGRSDFFGGFDPRLEEPGARGGPGYAAFARTTIVEKRTIAMPPAGCSSDAGTAKMASIGSPNNAPAATPISAYECGGVGLGRSPARWRQTKSSPSRSTSRYPRLLANLLKKFPEPRAINADDDGGNDGAKLHQHHQRKRAFRLRPHGRRRRLAKR